MTRQPAPCGHCAAARQHLSAARAAAASGDLPGAGLLAATAFGHVAAKASVTAASAVAGVKALIGRI